jgi:tetratricopeptide (TPR) repeat protein
MKRVIVFSLAVLLIMVSFETAFSQSRREGKELIQQGKQALKSGMYQEALEHSEKAFEIFKYHDHERGMAVSLSLMGKAYRALNQFDEALEHYDKALKIFREIDHPKGEASALNSVGFIYRIRGRYSEALEYYEEALGILSRAGFPGKRADTLRHIGNVYRETGQFKKALEYYEETLKIFRELDNKKGIASALNSMGNIYAAYSRYKKALNYYQESLALLREVNQPTNTAKSIKNIGRAYRLLGQYDEALKNYRESLKMFKKLNQPTLEAAVLQKIGEVYFAHGRYDEAIESFRESLEIFKRQNLPVPTAQVMNSIGKVYVSIGQYNEAIENFEEALKIFEKVGKKTHIPRSLQNIGNVYLALGLYHQALQYYDESLKIFKELDQPAHISRSLDKIGRVYFRLKDYEKAEVFFKKSEQVRKRKSFGMINISIVKGKYDEALRLLEEKKPRWFDPAPYRIRYYTQRGIALKGTGNLKDASGDFLEAVNLIEDMRQKLRGEKTGFFGVGGRLGAYRGLVSSLSERAMKGEKEDSRFTAYGNNLASAAFYFSESTKSRSLLEAMARSERTKQSIEIPEELKQKEASIIYQLSAIDAKWEVVYQKGEDYLEEFKERKEKLTSELNNLIKELRKKYPRYASLYYPKPFSPENLPLESDEVILEYALGKDTSYLFLARKGGVKRILMIPMGREALESKVKAFMEPLSIMSFKEFSIKNASTLHDILLSEALKDIKKDDKIIIIPDGILGLLPFEALVIKKGKGIDDSTYVGDRYSLNYYQSATVLALQRLLKDVVAKKPLFALGNPIYSKRDRRYIAHKEGKSKPARVRLARKEEYAFRSLAARKEWGKTSRGDKKGQELMYLPLPETEIEVKAIAKLFNTSPKPPDVLLDIYANETNLLRSSLKDYRYIHFATHADSAGMVQGVQEPFILLGQVENKGSDDGFLTLSEVLGLNLDAEIVVLSACVTGRGEMMEGEGLSNFTRVFQHAGARSVLVSLWEVASMEAVEYMKSFYAYLKSGKDKAEAMRLARNKIKSKQPNPFYWAVFILHGER